MRRTSTAQSIVDTIKRLRAAMPDIAIRTTFITGLPGERERDFKQLYEFAEKIRFDRLGVFAYSPEEGTEAASMSGQVDSEIAESRRDALMRLQQQISLERNERLIDTVQGVIVDGAEGEDVFHGRTRGDAPEIDGEVIFSAPHIQKSYDKNGGIIGKIVKVRITDAMDYDLVGEMVQE
jgi:ribosomal protein S12 methylthiotransferase